MKRFTALILAIMLLMVLVACNNEAENNTSNSATNTSNEATNTSNEEVLENIQDIVLKDVNVGERISFGAYEQDNDLSNGKEPIEWLVLDVEEDKALLISEYALDCVAYNVNFGDTLWEDCSLREWLNNSFTEEAFSSAELKKILKVTVPADDNPSYGTEAGNDTSDMVFLLSVDEAKKYFASDDERICMPTDYALTSGATINDDQGSCWWWLRSPGRDQARASYVLTGGLFDEFGYLLGNDDVGVRPALWVELD